MKKSELVTLIKETITESKMVLKEAPAMNYTYVQDQLGYAAAGHDWTDNMKVKFMGTKNNSKFIGITQEQFNAIVKLLLNKTTTKKISNFADKV